MDFYSMLKDKKGKLHADSQNLLYGLLFIVILVLFAPLIFHEIFTLSGIASVPVWFATITQLIVSAGVIIILLVALNVGK